ncbi:MAG TPA: DnaJ domain-containing protein [Elusimicrobiales bacterium]|nr:DnaJ domain-containing protein [Elusimicrobiales bacterium]HOL61775.1 DnaJ domain-containing protein [Elusimicrobiales bacterium]HPO94629.1 DnaJ domain-containing protein [Elusimicrobiales bacterium]
MEKTKSLIPKEKEYSLKIKNIKKKLFKKELELEKTVMEYLAMETSVKNFYKNYYLKKLGDYIVLLENLKNKVLGIEEKKTEVKEDKKENLQIEESEIKKKYRKLARLYHPDNFEYLDEEEKEFYDFRMGEINRAFEKRDIKTLERIEKRAEVELDRFGLSPICRIRYMEEDIYIIDKMIEMYKEKKKELSKEEIAVLMSENPQNLEKKIEEIKERLISEIKTYRRLCAKLGY